MYPNRKGTRIHRIALLVLSLSCLVLLAGTAQAQVKPGLSIREEMVKEIESYADGDVGSGLPLNDQLVINLFQNNQFGLTARDISQIYRKRYLADLEARKHWWDRLPGWLYVIFLVLAFFWRPLKKFIEERLGSAYEEVYKRHAGSKVFRGKALNRYRRSIVKQHLHVKIPFRDKPLAMRDVYVPLRVSDPTSASGIDAIDAIRTHDGLAIKGSPGSGKSMLLRAILLAYADERLVGIENDPIPVLVELSRLNDPATNLRAQLTAAFNRYGFPNADSFVAWALDNKALLLLLDGLDEVNAKERNRVVQAVNDLIQESECRFVVTCRSQVYHNEFDGTADATLEVAEFTDHEILRFLEPWRSSMKEDQSVEQLMKTLRDRPKILALARNPLLLTMIAYLYVDQHIALPHSRAEFYRQSTALLLEKWQGEFNRFGVPAKSAVLSRLALQFQAKPASDEDRRSLSAEEVLKLTREVLPGTTVKLEDAGDFLDEIVDRSGLLLRVDAGLRFQFTHLTMQEYFAATALAGDRNSLLQKFRLDPDTWREVVKLWCGLAQDSSDMIREIGDIEKTTAFECLADAKFIQPDFADKILLQAREILQQQLIANPASDPAIKALGLLASIPGPRGSAMLTWLAEQLKSTESDVHAGAAWALACSNLDYAADRLFQCQTPVSLAALESMGDVAVRPLLTSPVPLPAILVRIGTPHALDAAASLLWHADQTVSTDAAVQLARRLSDPIIEMALRTREPVGPFEGNHFWVPASQPQLDYAWVWQPFSEPETSSLPRIVSRIAFLLARNLNETVNPDIDPRLALALYADTKNDATLHALPRDMPRDITERASKLRPPTREDWLRIFQPTTFDLKNSLLAFAMKIITAALFLWWVFSLYKAHVFWPPAWWKIGVILAGSLPALSFWFFWFDRNLSSHALIVPACWPVLPEAFRDLYKNLRAKKKEWEGLILMFVLSPSFIFYPLFLIYFCSRSIVTLLPMPAIVALWIALGTAYGSLYFLVLREERRAENPLQGLLQLPSLLRPQKRGLFTISSKIAR